MLHMLQYNGFSSTLQYYKGLFWEAISLNNACPAKHFIFLSVLGSKSQTNYLNTTCSC